MGIIVRFPRFGGGGIDYVSFEELQLTEFWEKIDRCVAVNGLMYDIVLVRVQTMMIVMCTNIPGI